MRAIELGMCAAATAAVAVCGAATSAAESDLAGERASADMVGVDGEHHGTVTLEQTPHGVLLTLDLKGLPPGARAFHIHSVGKCERNFESAGGHFAPLGKRHGFRNEEGYHAGDLPNIHVPESGALKVEMFTHRVTLGQGKASLFDADGSSIVIHDKADDYRTDPAGAAGERIACGVVRKSKGREK